MARMRNTRPNRQGAQQYAPPPKSATGTVIAIIGWVGAGIALLAIMNSTSSQRRAEARIRMAAAEKQRVIDGRVADAEKAADAEVKKIDALANHEVAEAEAQILRKKAEAEADGIAAKGDAQYRRGSFTR